MSGYSLTDEAAASWSGSIPQIWPGIATNKHKTRGLFFLFGVADSPSLRRLDILVVWGKSRLSMSVVNVASNREERPTLRRIHLDKRIINVQVVKTLCRVSRRKAQGCPDMV